MGGGDMGMRKALCGETQDRWESLLVLLKGMGPLTVACSGGVDSRFLVHAARHAGSSLRVVHVSGPHVAAEETAYALEWTRSQGLDVHILELDPLRLPEVASGDRQRCYACKSFLFREILHVAEGVTCDGSNASDAGQHRPGLRALRELGIRSPLAEVGLDKDSIRFLAGRTGLEWPGQQSRACLLTRLPYGVPPDPELLGRLAAGEAGLEKILWQAGVEDVSFRLRIVENGGAELHIALESLSAGLRERLEASLEILGFPGAPIRCMPAIRGYFDRMKSS
jgi:uncharacterized protein